MTQYIVFDDNGIIHSSTDLDDAWMDFSETDDFERDLYLVEQLAVRR